MGTRKMRLYRLDVVLPAIGDPDDYDGSFDPNWVPPAWAQVDRERFRDEARGQAWRAAYAEHRDLPEDWEPGWSTYTPRPWPGWPAVKMYFSKSGAEARANLFRRYGASVQVIASKPVEWPDVDESAAPPRTPLRVVRSA